MWYALSWLVWKAMRVPSGLHDGRTDEVPSAVTCRMGPAASATCAPASPPSMATHHRRKRPRAHDDGAKRRPSPHAPGMPGLAERLKDRSLDQALGDIDLVRVETHRPRHGTDLGSRLLD